LDLECWHVSFQGGERLTMRRLQSSPTLYSTRGFSSQNGAL
jgi:hypothetical protein